MIHFKKKLWMENIKLKFNSILKEKVQQPKVADRNILMYNFFYLD
jgi:hypothetical protein